MLGGKNAEKDAKDILELEGEIVKVSSITNGKTKWKNGLIFNEKINLSIQKRLLLMSCFL